MKERFSSIKMFWYPAFLKYKILLCELKIEFKKFR